MEQHIRLWRQHDVNLVPTQTYMGCSVAPQSQQGTARINMAVTQIRLHGTKMDLPGANTHLHGMSMDLHGVYTELHRAYTDQHFCV